MPTPSSGNPISFLDLQNEFGGSNPISMNEYGDKIGLTVNTTTTHDLADFYGLSNAAWPGSGENSWFKDGIGTEYPTSQQCSRSAVSPTYAQAGLEVAFSNDQTNDRIACRVLSYVSTSSSSYTYGYVGYDGYDTETFQAKCEYALINSGFVGSVQNPSSASPASGTYASISTSGYSPAWKWEATVSSGSGTRSLASITTGGNSPLWTVRAGTSGSTVISGPDSSNGGRDVSVSATRGTAGPPGGGEICVHEDMLVSTQNGKESIHTIKDSVSRIWAWNSATSTKELVDLLQINIINHDNLYTVNNLKLTEDHPVYLEGYVKASINPAKTLENYEVTVNQLAVGDKLMKEDGTLETVTSIEVLAEEHVTYTIKTKHNNFYADGYLVDSEI